MISKHITCKPGNDNYKRLANYIAGNTKHRGVKFDERQPYIPEYYPGEAGDLAACVGCPNALWFIEHLHKEQREEVKAFCQLMHAVITNPMKSCDGTQVFPQQEKSAS